MNSFVCAILVSVIAVDVANAHLQLVEGCNLSVSINERVIRVKQNILNKLGLSRPPLSAPELSVPPNTMDSFMALQAVERIREDEEFKPCTQSNAVSTLIRATSAIRATPVTDDYIYYGPNGFFTYRKKRHYASNDYYYMYYDDDIEPPLIYRFTFFINTTSPYPDREIMSSQLLLFQSISSNGRQILNDVETIELSFVYKTNYGYSTFETKQEILETKVVNVEEKYISFDTTHAVRKWMELNIRETGEIMFEVTIKSPEILLNNQPLSPILEFNTSEPKTATFIINYSSNIENLSTFRKKRQISKLDEQFCFANPNEPNCCVKSLKIDFANDLNYTFVVMPREYDPNYCSGFCPSFWPTASNSTTILQDYKERNPSFAVEPCCAPDELGSLSMLLSLGENQFAIQTLPNMIIKSCICR